MTSTDITIHSSMLPLDDPEESLAFYRDVLGFEVRLDVGKDKMRWITVGPPNQPAAGHGHDWHHQRAGPPGRHRRRAERAAVGDERHSDGRGDQSR
ncbi:VOC family protein, partial [Mycolicibacterium porcinum]|uniref:VOC family protein n=1 Tax=Mycolicibacterium porcinum TaxID=39693 RepID=UPI000A5A7A0E